MRGHYFRDVLPAALPQLECELARNSSGWPHAPQPFFVGESVALGLARIVASARPCDPLYTRSTTIFGHPVSKAKM